MDVKPDRHGRWMVALILVATLFVFTGTVVAYADAASDRGPGAVSDQRQPAAAPTLTPIVTVTPDAGDAAEPAVVDDTLAQPTVPSPAAPVSQPTATTPAPATGVAPSAANLVGNGGFENGFVEGIAVGWQRFATGLVQAGWQDDTWEPVLYEGSHAQLLTLKEASQRDQYVGIFQTMTVAPAATYVLTLHGLIRSDEGSIVKSNFGYRLQYGIDYAGGQDWQSPGVQWVELPWDEQPRTIPPAGGYRIETYAATVMSQGPRLTLFVRAWKKWPGAAEGDYDIDGVSLVVEQAAPAAAPPPPPTVSGAEPPSAPQMPQTGGRAEFVSNNALALASVLLVVLLVAGVVWKSSRRRT